MRFLNVVLMLAATTLVAQEPPYPPARAPRPGQAIRPAAPTAPVRAPEARWAPLPTEGFPTPPPAPRPGFGFSTPLAAPTPMAAPAPYGVPAPAALPTPVMAPEPPEPPEPPYFVELPQGRGQQGRVIIDRSEVERIAQQAREMAREQSQLQRERTLEVAQQAREMAREQSDMAREMAREIAQQDRQFGLTSPVIAPRPLISGTIGGAISGAFANIFPEFPPRSWAQADPADSLWRSANDVMNKGDYRKAASIFKDLPAKFPYSVYAADAMYWNAHALYRVGSVPDLQEALQTLETLKTKYPNSRLRNSQSDVGALQVRIAGVLSQRGQGGSEIVKRALAQNPSVCDSEDAQMRSAALNALMQTDPDAAMQYAVKILARKDDCSRDLRRNALFLIGERRGSNGAISAPAIATLISVAKSDPSPDVRQTAVSFLGRTQSDEALAALEELMKSSDDQGVQREAVRALARNANPRARAGIRALVERNDVSETLRVTALDAFDQERATQEDITWLQGLFGKVESPRIRSRIINAMGRLGGTQNEKWFTTLANNENESIDVRLEAVRRAGQSMDIPALGRLYDQTGQRQLRSEIVSQLGRRKESETIDKLADIVKNGTDPQVRQRAIEALTNKKDDRATKVLLSLLDRP